MKQKLSKHELFIAIPHLVDVAAVAWVALGNRETAEQIAEYLRLDEADLAMLKQELDDFFAEDNLDDYA